MTKKEMEQRIINLEVSLANLASKSHDKDSACEVRIGDVESDAETMQSDISDIETATEVLEGTIDYIFTEVLPLI